MFWFAHCVSKIRGCCDTRFGCWEVGSVRGGQWAAGKATFTWSWELPPPPSSYPLLPPSSTPSSQPQLRWSPEWKFRGDTSKVFWVLVGGFSGWWPALTEGARGWSASTFTQLLVPRHQHGPTPCLTHGKTARRTTGVERGKMGIWYRGSATDDVPVNAH